MKKYILTIGLNDKDTKVQKFDTITAYKLIEQTLKQYTDGYTIYETHGGYKHDNGIDFVSEHSIRVELSIVTDIMVRTICNTIKAPTMLNQESILVEIYETQSALY